MRRLLVALSILTVLPLRVDHSPEKLVDSTICFPLAGALIGSALGALQLVQSRLLPAQVAAAVLLAAAWLLTGGMHLDGLADTADGLACSPQAKALEAMHDPRVGAAGAGAISLILLLKWSCLVGLPPHCRVMAVFLMPVVGRQAVVMAMTYHPSARPGEGLGSAFARKIALLRLLPTLGITVALLLLASWLQGGPLLPWALAVAVGLGSSLLLATHLSRRLGGMTGDTYGALCEVAEGAFLLGALLWPARGL
ncbi:MAG TPA: adenosylcobinamide-GDP ribazoletransferase [Firmicutes bacterium]|nr:adenosylcobinamide-GDP ribazoletransferase [Bacillota bacterium]